MTQLFLVVWMALGGGVAPIVQGPKAFPSIAEKQELFRVTMPRNGRFRFCLTGTKPQAERFVFQALVTRGRDVYRVDYVTAAPTGQPKVESCATMKQDEPELKAGETVRIESILKTAGPVTLTLKVEDSPKVGASP